ncbi:hypothetical protein [Streptomyces sp. NPDC001389]|uniref:hypothetical protein n=1 Tax=Streptomyces sp. NPDC001389 TaxID=3364569 RepID=UPI0036AB4A33
MTDRVRAACEVAVALAVESADDPGILQATIDLGKLEGMWALLFQRRDQLLADQAQRVRKAWLPLVDRTAVAAAVDQLLAVLGVQEADRGWLYDLRTAARAAARALLRGIAGMTGFGFLRAALRDVLAAGRAEGMVEAVAIASERASRIGLDWEIAFKDAYQAMSNLDDLWAGADGWLARVLDGGAGDLGRALADGMEAGLGRDDLIDAAMDVLTAEEGSVAFVVDWAMTTAADEGALALYRGEGVLQIDIITAADGRVCSACIDAEAGSPWYIGDQPRLPMHPNCRCVYSADISLAHFAAWMA